MNLHLICIAQTHERNIIADEIELTGEGHAFLVALIEHVAHHLRQLQDGGFRLLGIDVNQCMDVVECIHEEMGVDLVFQILQLLFQILLLQSEQFLLIVARLEIVLHAQVHATD